MINAYSLTGRRLEPIPLADAPERLPEAAWIDLVAPSDEDRARVEIVSGQELPTIDELEEIEASARSFEDERGLHIHSFFLYEADGRAHNTTVAFTLAGSRLLTLRDRELAAFRLLRLRARRGIDVFDDAASILINLFDTKVDELADRLEQVYRGLEGTGHAVLEEEDADLEDAIAQLARFEDLNGKVRLCLLDTQRALSFLLRRGRIAGEQAEEVRDILRDIESLLPHSTFLFDKVNFLMDAAQGFINIEQNHIIKIFSIAAVVFLPPTLVASIYGMNFSLMPELDWQWGYPLAIVLMVLAGIAPYWYFKRKGWL